MTDQVWCEILLLLGVFRLSVLIVINQLLVGGTCNWQSGNPVGFGFLSHFNVINLPTDVQ